MHVTQDYGWFVRRTADVPGLATFYRDVIGFTQIADNPQFCVFWGGGASVFEILPTNRPSSGPPSDRTAQVIIPTIGCVDIDLTIGRLHESAVEFIEDTVTDSGRFAYFLDPSDQITGLVQFASRSTAGQSNAFDSIWQDRTPAIPGVAMHRDDLGQIGLITLHVADVVAETAFYVEVLGRGVIGELADGRGVLINLGGGVLLNIAPGGRVEPLMADRSEADNMWMIQARDMPGFITHLRKLGVRLVNEPFVSVSETIAYFADPEGHIVGVNDGAGSEVGFPVRAEANRRWRQSASR